MACQRTTREQQAATLLRKAAERLESRGWTQTVCCNGERTCLSTAVFMAAAENGFPEGALETALVAVRQAVGYVSLAEWNDEPGRSLDEVTQTLRSVADRLS